MKKAIKNHSKIWVFLCFVLAFLFLISAFGGAQRVKAENEKYKSIADIAKKPVGIMSSSTYADIGKENGYFDDSTEIRRYNTELDAIEALRNGKIGSYINTEIYNTIYTKEFEDLMIFPDAIGEIEYAFALQKNSALTEKFNQAMRELKSEGVYEELYEKWYGDDSENAQPIQQDWEGKNGTLNYWVNIGPPPMAYVSEGGDIIGFAPDFILMVAKRLGYRVKITECNLAGLVPALVSGEADIAGRSLAVTEERKQSVDFSDAFIKTKITLLVRKEDVDESIINTMGTTGANSNHFFTGIIESIEKTFITENRWKLFLTGIGITLLITISSAVFGTILGLLLYMLFMQEHKILNQIMLTFNRWISGVPVVVILMLMYYAILSKTPLDATAVAIITFTILFGIGVFGLLKTGVEAVGKGQIESAVDLGFTKNQIFFKIILPQTVLYIMPLYRSKMVEHLKATAIVGYIAITDLTKMSDLIRSRTFEAFFPLIATAILYYLLGRMLDLILCQVEKNMKSDKRKIKMLKGVNLHD